MQQQDAFTDLPEVVERAEEKQVAPGHEKEVVTSHGIEARELRRSGVEGADGPEAVGVHGGGDREQGAAKEVSDDPPKKPRRRRVIGCIVVIVILVLSIGLGVGLGVGLNANNKSK